MIASYLLYRLVPSVEDARALPLAGRPAREIETRIRRSETPRSHGAASRISKAEAD